jgi:peptidoglycan/xylan/chitin deacetylase (PgdA/CDA1 family)
MKEATLKIAHSSGFFFPFRYFNRNKLLILMYHRFSTDSGPFATSASDFENHLKYIRQRYRVVSLSDATTLLSDLGKLPPRTAVITIDDGYRDVYTVALPILRKYEMPATLFVVSDFLDRKIWLWTDKARFLLLQTQKTLVEFESEHEVHHYKLSDRNSRLSAAASINLHLKKMPDAKKEFAIKDLGEALKVEIPGVPPADFEALTWDELAELESSRIEAGSHTVTHPVLTRVNRERVRLELRNSKTRLESVLNHKVSSFCYPNGATNDEVTGEVRLAGYECAVTATHGFNQYKPDPLLLSRIAAENDLPHFAQNISGFESFKNSLR